MNPALELPSGHRGAETLQALSSGHPQIQFRVPPDEGGARLRVEVVAVATPGLSHGPEVTPRQVMHTNPPASFPGLKGARSRVDQDHSPGLVGATNPGPPKESKAQEEEEGVDGAQLVERAQVRPHPLAQALPAPRRRRRAAPSRLAPHGQRAVLAGLRQEKQDQAKAPPRLPEK